MMENQHNAKNVMFNAQVVLNNLIHAYHVPQQEKQKQTVNARKGIMILAYNFVLNVILIALHAKLHHRIAHLVILTNLENLTQYTLVVIVCKVILKLMEFVNNAIQVVKLVLNLQLIVLLAFNIDT
ncbi:unnamed protein product [Paramecium octaurelia]|uniref:Transmembrane protein n=1 Tax=Paramecium octaurelia TaxID=43137 RepID=A0A8S1WWF3_PAROT|nr:unnamed protein product [Paramecium octaurelia]